MSHESPIFIFFSFYHDPPPTDLYTLSLHDALPILPVAHPHVDGKPRAEPPPHGSGLRLGELANRRAAADAGDRKSTRLNSSHRTISYAVFCLKKKIRKWRALESRQQ